ncbi:chemotaxis protein methyltransferase CheR [Thermodesulfitimonas autotrophica]|uniref:protein-glutamate O-methyltransferase n=1 Tax=Thermodesulfitimonas autotrophica TaxID=1894989 RepID=A0A3N5AGH1_9THEO|nr:protein-glutamate O-methyltransferase CheR [Thermodesulfitimonas autotrophica]RPF42940.1 chemotaxis protein methyltransferase CheR [Thermodesulfitimonas autotrophica]
MNFDTFRQKMHTAFGIDLTSYKETQLKRRTGNLMARRGIGDYAAYFNLLKNDREALQEFLDYLTINVTEFFRDPAMFRILEEKVIPELWTKRSLLKIWSAACSNGAEPYSVVMILEDLRPGGLYRIEATDIDRKILAAAIKGAYPAELLKNVSPARLAKYFRKEGDQFVFREEFKRRVAFKYHDLLKDPYGKGYDLIICRNVQIYFTKEAQNRLIKQFSEALSPGGYLFIGASETIFNYRDFGLEKSHPSFYRKV